MSGLCLDLDDLRIISICASRFRLDGGAMYGVVPRVLWAPVTPPDARHRIPIACNCLLIEDESGNRLLVDTGLGQRFDKRSRDIFAVDPATTLAGSLDKRGIHPDTITHVILTHLHFDHAAGALVSDGADGVRALFPQARHLVQAGEIHDALAGRSVMRSSYVRSDIQTLRSTAELGALSGDGEISRGVSVEVTGGHTQHHQAVIVHTANHTLVYPGDLIPTRHHLRHFWIMAYDMFPHDTLTTKAMFIQRALRENWIIAWDHDPDEPFSRLRQQGDHIVAVPLEPELIS